ncbi:Uncharacterised protein [Halioglobus japonicus]|nr:Uncharacterised protein [Halioglobus japonicus]
MSDELEPKHKVWIGLGIFFLAIVGLAASGEVFFTTSGCTLPVDLVLGDTCLFGSMGASIGMSLAATIGFAIVFGILGLMLNGIRNALRRKLGDRDQSGDGS